MATTRAPAQWRRVSRKALWTLGVVVVFRLGAAIPVPGVTRQGLAALHHAAGAGGLFGLLNLLSGGTLGRMSIFAVGIGSYLIATMLVQMLGALFPKLKAGSASSIDASSRVIQLTRYMVVPLAVLEGLGLLFALHDGSVLHIGPIGVDMLGNLTVAKGAMIVALWVAGAVLAMWMAESVTQRGVGSGAGVLILSGVLAGLSGSLQTVFAEVTPWLAAVIVAAAVVATVGIVVVDQAQLRVPVRYSKPSSERAQRRSYLPLKMNKAGVMPAIIALTMTTLPGAIGSLVPATGFWRHLHSFLAIDLGTSGSIGQMVFIAVLIVGMSYAYTAAAFDADDAAEELARAGGFVVGMRPGPETAEYLERTIRQLAVFGAVCIAVLAIAPEAIAKVMGIPAFPISGTTLLIVAVSGADMVRRFGAEVVVSRYQRQGIRPRALASVDRVPAKV